MFISLFVCTSCGNILDLEDTGCPFCEDIQELNGYLDWEDDDQRYDQLLMELVVLTLLQ